ncbi:hypothetical protein Hanom_Chr09g00781051 [Helianthus anomalus]
MEVYLSCVCHLRESQKGGYDGLNLDTLTTMLKLRMHQLFNISGLIFYKLSTWAVYPRFLRIIINSQHENLPHNSDLYMFDGVTDRLFTEC